MPSDIDAKPRAVKADLAEQLEPIAQKIECLETTAILHIAGEAAKIHAVFRYRRDEGGYTGYMKKRLGYSSSSAYRLLDVHARFGTNVSHPWERLPRKALYLLAAPSTPEEVLTEVAERIEAGERASVAMVTAVIAKAKGEATNSEGERPGDAVRDARPAESDDANAFAPSDTDHHTPSAPETPSPPIMSEAPPPAPATSPAPTTTSEAPSGDGGEAQEGARSSATRRGPKVKETSSAILDTEPFVDATLKQQRHFVDDIGTTKWVDAVPETWRLDMVAVVLWQRMSPEERDAFLNRVGAQLKAKAGEPPKFTAEKTVDEAGNPIHVLPHVGRSGIRPGTERERPGA